MHRVLAVLDTDAGPNFIRISKLPKGFEEHMSFGPLPDICDANKNPLCTLGTIKIPVVKIVLNASEMLVVVTI